MVLAEQATIPSQTLRGETGSEREQDRHMWLGQLGTEASPTAARIISGAGGGNFGSWLEEVACPWGRSSHTLPNPASSLCFLTHCDINLAAPLSVTVYPNQAFLCIRISHRDRN